MNKTYIKELDGVRAVAAIMVMIGHYFASRPLHGNSFYNLLQGIFSFGQAGVTLFFVLSGFLITRILLATKNEGQYFKKFYLRRMLRIFPLYYFFLIVLYFVLPSFTGHTIPTFKEQIWYWLYIQNISDNFKLGAVGPSHFWSLAIEEQFYLFWPLIIFYIDGKKIGIVAVVTIGIAIILRITMLANGLEVYYFTFTRMDELALGALLAYIEVNRRDFLVFNKMFLGFIFVFALMIVAWLLMPARGNVWIQMVKYPLISFSSFFLIGAVVSGVPFKSIRWIFNNGFMSNTGKYSYGLYVYHPLIFSLASPFLKNIVTPIQLLISFGATYGVAMLSFKFIETPFLRLKRHYNYSKE